jgi:Leucine-rich repeat (LRR) protein
MNRLDWDITLRKIFLFFLGIVVLLSLLMTTARADSEITFRDEHLESAVREALNKPVKSIFQSDLNKVTYLDASGRAIENLDGIDHLYNLVVLDLSDNFIKDVGPLRALHNLTELNLSRNGIADLNALDFNVLANVPIKDLNLEENQIQDLTPLHTLANLRILDLRANRITDVFPLGDLNLLVELNLRDNNITDLEPLSGLRELEYLNLHSNSNISSTLPLENLTRLETLIMENIPLGENISILSNMEHLTRLNIANSNVTDISPLHKLTALTVLNLRANDITELSPVSGLTNLVYLNIYSNSGIQSVLPLENLTRLETLIMANVPIGSDVYVLRNMTNLKSLNIRNCGVTSAVVLGDLMRGGALQDNQDRDIRAYVDLRDNPISLESTDLYAPIRPYWENIDHRIPFKLPNHYTLAPPRFSHPAGYYERPFELVLETEEDTNIYYTLDGSEPTTNDLVYDGPITVQSRSGESAVLAEIQEISPRWVSPAGEVFKATVVRARVIDEDGKNSSPTVTHTFIVDETKRYTFPIVSLTTDPEYLFDYNYGIYVMGKVYDEMFDPNPELNPWERAANYNQYGEEWERPIHIEFFEADGDLGFSQDAGVRIHGTATRERAQKSLRIYAQDADGEYDSINYELFPGLMNPITGEPVESFKTILLRNSGNDWESTLFRDALMQSLVDHTLIGTQAYRPVIVFLNGEYWGIYNLRERVDEYYLASYYDLNPENIVLLSNNGVLNAGLPGDEQNYLDMLAFIKTNDITDEENYAYVQTLMDVENYIDYQIAEIYFNNTNWPHANIKYWRKRTDRYEPNAPYGHDGRWRWIIYDTDFGFGFDGGNSAVEHNNLLNATHPISNEWAGELLLALLKNPEFRVSFINRFADHLNTSFTPHRVIKKIDQMQSVLEPEIEEALRRWRGRNGSVAQWNKAIDGLRYFGEYRPGYVRQHIVEYFDLTGRAKVTLLTDESRGHIIINSIAITEDTPGIEDPSSWSGIYFRGVPITITAVPNPRYRFVRWEGVQGVDPTLETLTIPLEDDLSLRAVFETTE